MEPIRLTVRVVNEAGDPIEGAFVTAESSVSALPEIAMMTNAVGELVLCLPPSRVTLRANWERYRAIVVLELSDDGGCGAQIAVITLPAGK